MFRLVLFVLDICHLWFMSLATSQLKAFNRIVDYPKFDKNKNAYLLFHSEDVHLKVLNCTAVPSSNKTTWKCLLQFYFETRN